jgi:hypothetical protein
MFKLGGSYEVSTCYRNLSKGSGSFDSTLRYVRFSSSLKEHFKLEIGLLNLSCRCSALISACLNL